MYIAAQQSLGLWEGRDLVGKEEGPGSALGQGLEGVVVRGRSLTRLPWSSHCQGRRGKGFPVSGTAGAKA